MFFISARKWGNVILSRFIDDQGKDVSKEVEFEPQFYMKNTASTSFDRKAMTGNHGLSLVRYESIKEFTSAVDSYASTGIIYGQDNVELQFLSRTYPGDIMFDQDKIRLAIIDIEVDSSDGFPDPQNAVKEITAITQYDSIDDVYRVYSLVPWSPENSIFDKDILDRVRYVRFSSERELILGWLSDFQQNYPATLSGWYSNGFDIPYLYNRIANVLGKDQCDKLSPFGIVRKKDSFDRFGEPEISIDIYGINCLDYVELYQKFTVKPRESHKLGYISYIELDEKKLDYSEEGSLDDLRMKNPQKYVDYNIKDVLLVRKLNQKLQLLPLAYYIAYTAKINPINVYSPVKIWDSLVFNYLDSKGISPPIIDGRKAKTKYEGAYVKPPIIGPCESVVSFDVASLYPSIIRQWNMCPSTIMEKDSLPYGRYVDEMLDSSLKIPQGDFCLAANGVAFSNKVPGIFPALVKQLFDDRKMSKKLAKDLKVLAEKKKLEGNLPEYDRLKYDSSAADAKQGAIKVLLNSLYGACGNVFFRYFDLRIAEGITRTGQVVIRWVERDINKFVSESVGTEKDRCVAIDTDSVIFTLHDLVTKYFKDPPETSKQINFLDKSCKLLEEKVIKPSFSSLLDYCRCIEPAIEMKREVIATKAFWMAAKAYALDVHDMEGVRYAEPEIVAKGLKLVKSETPEFCREALRRGVEIILRGSDPDRIIEFIDETWSKFSDLKIEDMASTTAANDIDKWVSKVPGKLCEPGTPQQARAAIVYNDLIRKNNLSSRYETIKAGNKVKILFLRTPNISHSSVVGCPIFLPKELGLHEHVDKRRMFETNFLKSLVEMCEILNVKTRKVESIEDFFS